MPFAPPPSTGSNDEILFPKDLLREAASTIFNNAMHASENHGALWNTVENWIQASAPKDTLFLLGDLVDVRSYLTNVLQPHAERLRASYDWQMSFASALMQAIDTIETTDEQIAASFDGTSSPQGTQSTSHFTSHYRP
ncbi:MAG: hypothetical protein ABI456_08565 [Ktedonobacteraceae bacterium]|nr:hypothetical protein [Chloroflexota bacterium]